jgi:low temperature requirement protein LtrA
LVLLALWSVWLYTSWTTSRFNRLAGPIHVMVAGLILGSLLMAVSLPRAFTDRGLLFAGACAATQICRPLYLTLLLGNHPRRRNQIRMLCWGIASSAFWIAGALLPNPTRFGLWTCAVVLNYVGDKLGWRTPGLGRAQNAQWTLAGVHLAERYQQFFIIALGESILFTGLTFGDSEFTPARTAAFLASFANTLLLWQFYFYRAGSSLPAAMTAAPHAGRLGQSSNYTQLAMVTGVLVTAVADKLAIADPFGRPHLRFAIIILCGPGLFLVARLRFGYEVFGRTSATLVAGPVALIVLAPLMLIVAPVISLIGSAAVLATTVALHLINTDATLREPTPPF